MDADDARHAPLVVLHLHATRQDVDIVAQLVSEPLDHLEALLAVFEEVGEALRHPVAILLVDQGGPGHEGVRQLVLGIAELLLPAP